MIQVTAYNEYSVKDNSRVVARYDVQTTDIKLAFTDVRKKAIAWNRNEKRQNMRVNFIGAGGMICTV